MVVVVIMTMNAVVKSRQKRLKVKRFKHSEIENKAVKLGIQPLMRKG